MLKKFFHDVDFYFDYCILFLDNKARENSKVFSQCDFQTEWPLNTNI